MSALMKCLRSGAYIAIGALTFVLGASTNVQGCHGGGGGYSRGGGGYPGQGPNGTGSQNYPSAIGLHGQRECEQSRHGAGPRR